MPMDWKIAPCSFSISSPGKATPQDRDCARRILGRPSPASSKNLAPKKFANCSRSATPCRPRSTTGTAPHKGKSFDYECLHGLPEANRLSAAGSPANEAGRRRLTSMKRSEKSAGPQLVRAPHPMRAMRSTRRNARWGSLVRCLLRYRRDPARPERGLAAATTRAPRRQG